MISKHRSLDKMALTKADIINAVQVEEGLTKQQGTEIIETLIEIMKSTLETGEDVLISGFGKFCVREKSERKGRNPATGNDLMLSPRKVVTFKCSGKLRDRINK
jgi:integration host factor subunit alpha